MIIRKEYNVGLLSAELKKEVIEAEKVSNFYVRVPILVAKDIVDVLDETLEKEKRNQTLESELQFVETEDEGQTNEMEEEMNKETPKHKRPSCFKHFYENCKQCDNDECIHRTECKEKSARRRA